MSDEDIDAFGYGDITLGGTLCRDAQSVALVGTTNSELLDFIL